MENTLAVALGRLTSYEQWKPWLSQIKAMALEADIWQQINPDLPIEPERPPPPSEPIPSEIRQDAQSTSDLTIQEVARLRDLRGIYQQERSEYESQSKARRMITGLIVATVDPKYKSYLLGQLTPYQQLRTLSELFQASDRTRVQTLRRKWRSLFEFRVTHDTAEKWLLDAHQQYIEGNAAGVPEIQHQESVTFDILHCLKHIAPGFCDIWYHEIFNKSRKIGVPRLIRIFQGQRELQAIKQGHPLEAPRGVFSTWQGHLEAQPEPHRCVCGKLHPFQRCFYLNPIIRPPNFQLHQPTVFRIREKLDEATLTEIKKVLPGFNGLEEVPQQTYSAWPSGPMISF
ncbi:hypothetical protein VN97_g12988 [Penicillium thymicola]|uniref:Uncharacterized protein n=1 Tax=Penicillium thymicola TaxID=293382 RepID=A0AAI9X1S9_PENTH|nr:hypothetical protein VN97_g12988 [Penicillium thymicola]